MITSENYVENVMRTASGNILTHLKRRFENERLYSKMFAN